MFGEKQTRVGAGPLKDFCIRVFRKLDVSLEDARIAADVLVSADLRGIASHGVARLRRYIEGLRSRSVVTRPEARLIQETATTATIDAGAGLGHPVSYRAMQRAIRTALEMGVGFVAVRNSNHFGIAGYYAMMALEHGCIGLSMTNADTLVVPTFGKKAMLGTNALAFAAPAGRERPFVLDMATSTVPRGKLEVYSRRGEPIPIGWATGADGKGTRDAREVLENLCDRAGGGLLPVGGEGELLSGHKGYGMVMLVEVLCAVLSGAAHADQVYPRASDGKPLPSKLGHFFGAWRADAFRPLAEFQADMDDLEKRIKDSPKADGQSRIYIHGEKEYEKTELHLRDGIPLEAKVTEDLRAIASALGVEYGLEGGREPGLGQPSPGRRAVVAGLG